MQESSVFLKRGLSSGATHVPERKIRCELITSDAEFVVRDGAGKECVLRVPNALKLDGPDGLVMDAVDGCALNIPPMQGFWKAFSESFNPAENPELDFCLRLFSKSSPVVNLDNPGHVLLAIRGLMGDDICKAHTAYIKALALCTCHPDMRGNPETLMDPKRLLWFHAGICKMLGSCFHAAPLPPGTFPTADYMTIFYELLKKAAYPVIKDGAISDVERREIMHALRSWHCPKYVRNIFPTEAKLWSFDKPRERAASIVQALKKTTTQKA